LKKKTLKEGINEFKYDVKKETSVLKEGLRLGLELNEVRNDAKRDAGDVRKEAFELKEMMRQLMNNSNSSTQHTPGTSTEKEETRCETPINQSRRKRNGIT
jgi:hypothetical protein